LDSDDLWALNKLDVQLHFMERNREIGLVFSDHEEFNTEEIVLKSFLAQKMFRADIVSQNPIQEAFRKLVIENFISTPTVMVRKGCFEKAGLFDESLRSVEDRDLWLRIAAYYKIACLPLILTRRRIHETNISRESDLSMYGRIKVLENNRRRFSYLAPAGIWNTILADAYFQFGYILLAKDKRKEALLAGFRSLLHAVTQLFRNGPSSSYPWIMAIGLIPATFLGWQMSRCLWQAGSGLFIRTSKQQNKQAE
jgi:hypothetical protein